MAKKAKKAKRKVKAKRLITPADARFELFRRVPVQLDQLKAELTGAIFGLANEVRRLESRVKRLEDGHSGDREAHAALAPGYVHHEQPDETSVEEPADGAGEVAREAEEQGS